MADKLAKSGTNARASEHLPAAEWVPIKSLKQWDRNPRNNRDNVARVAASIQKFGFAAPIVARAEDGEIIAGHTRILAAESLGLELVPVRFMDLSAADAHVLALADNRLNELSSWDGPALERLLSEMGLERAQVAGWSSEDLERMAAELLSEESAPEPDSGEPAQLRQTTCPACGHSF